MSSMTSKRKTMEICLNESNSVSRVGHTCDPEIDCPLAFQERQSEIIGKASKSIVLVSVFNYLSPLPQITFINI